MNEPSRGRRAVREAELAALRARDGHTDPYRYAVDHSVADVRARHGDLGPTGSPTTACTWPGGISGRR